MRLSGTQRVGLVAVAMVVVAEGAVWLLGAGEEPIEAADVSLGDYFPAAEIERGRDYRQGQLLLDVGGLGIQVVLLGAVALGRPRAVRRALERLESRPLVGGAAAGAGLAVLLAIATVPTGIWAHERAVDFGISIQPLGPWLADVGKSAAIGALIAAAGAALLIALLRRAPRGWPLPAAAAVVAAAVVLTWISPVVLAPLFNRFEALPADSALRAEVLELAERAGVDVGEVYRVDASRRVTALNAYVGGIGPTKRVVLYDNLIARADEDELRSVVAHELAHQAHNDIGRGIAFVAIVAPLGLLFAREAGGLIARRAGARRGSVASLPAYALAIGAASFILGIPGNQLSRKLEAAADAFALRLTDDPQALIGLQRQLVSSNVSNPDPPDAVTFVFGTHPPPIERIGTAVAFAEREQRGE